MEPNVIRESPSNADEDLARARRKQAAVIEYMRKTGKNGKHSAGMIQDTELAREAFALGEAYRRAQKAP
jgi:hypothetical protein